MYAQSAGAKSPQPPSQCPRMPNGYGTYLMVASPQLPYSLARQYPTLLADPFALLSQVLPNGDVDLWYSFVTFACQA